MQFALDEKQVLRFEEWKCKLLASAPEIAEEWDHEVSMTSPFTFDFTNSGLGPIVNVRCGDDVLSLTYDDDGNFCD